MSKKRVFVTGCNGFIGTNFCKMFDSEYDIQGCDINDVMGNQTWEWHDVSYNDSYITHVIHEFEPDTIVHFGAMSNIKQSMLQPIDCITTNGVNVLDLYKVANSTNVKKIIQMSSSAVIDFKSYYGISKHVMEVVSNLYSQIHGLPIYNLRLGNVYGPYQFTDTLIPNATSRLLKRQSVQIYGDGNNIRDYIYVADVCNAIKAIIDCDSPGDCSKPLWVTTGESITTNEMVDNILEAYHRIFPDNTKPVVEHTDPLASDIIGDPLPTSEEWKYIGWEPYYTEHVYNLTNIIKWRLSQC